MALTLTSTASEHVRSQLARRGAGIGLRVGIKTAGCSGLAYVLEFVDAQAPGDQVFEASGFKVFVDPKSLVHLDGAELDFAREGLNEGFTFRNPNASSECGCGESFHV